MYGGCALPMEQSEVPPKAAADLRVGCASVCAAGTASGGQRGCGGACGVRVRIESGGATAVVDAAARWRHGALRGSGGAGFHVRLTPQCRGAVGCGSVCGVAAAGTANAVGGALPCGRRRGCGRAGGLALVGGTGVAGARVLRRRRMARSARRA